MRHRRDHAGSAKQGRRLYRADGPKCPLLAQCELGDGRAQRSPFADSGTSDLSDGLARESFAYTGGFGHNSAFYWQEIPEVAGGARAATSHQHLLVPTDYDEQGA